MNTELHDWWKTRRRGGSDRRTAQDDQRRDRKEEVIVLRSWLRFPYQIVARTAELATAIAPAQSTSKVFKTFGARQGLLTRYEQWSAAKRDGRRPLLWMHAPSVGEGLMALPILQQIRAELPDVQIAYTFFSPSAERFAQTLDVDFAGYLPFDTTTAMAWALDALNPTALVFSKLDVWPTLVEQAAMRRVKLGLTSASMARTSSRTHGVGAAFTYDAYTRLDRVGAASQDDAEALIHAGVRPERIQVTGDTRYDQAWTRARIIPRNVGLVNRFATQRLTLVAGSTWPADKAVLFPAWERVRAATPSARLLIAPHEIKDAQIHRIERWAQQSQLVSKRIDDPDAPTADIVIIDRIGILADLYKVATVAYVGGGFHSHGLHSVVEPAVFHVPTIVGPRSSNSRDAKIMQRNGGLIVANDALSMGDALIRLMTHTSERSHMQQRLASTISSELGATQRSFELVRQLLGAV